METKNLMKIKRRRGLGELGSLVILMLFGILVLTSASLFYTGIIVENGGATPADAATLSGATQAYGDLNASVVQMGDTLRSSQSMPLGTGVFYVMFQGAFQSVQMLFNVLGIFSSLFGTSSVFLTSILGVNLSMIIGMLLAITIIYVIWRLIEGGTGRQW